MKELELYRFLDGNLSRKQIQCLSAWDRSRIVTWANNMIWYHVLAKECAVENCEQCKSYVRMRKDARRQ